MTRLINSLASLTDLRDRDELEITLASVIFDLVGPTKLTLWRLVSDAGQLRLRPRVYVSAGSRAAVCDTPADVRELRTLDSEPGLRACYDSKSPLCLKPSGNGQRGHVYPVMSGKDVAGLLEIDNPAPLREYQERVIAGLLRVYRNHLSVLDECDYDELTGLLNRKTFDDCFGVLVTPEARGPANPVQLDRRRTTNASLQSWLAVADIDYFKRINDGFGHLYGDEVLVLLARLMRSLFRESDRVFRFGGEEFVVVLRCTEQRYAQELLERCRAAVEAFDFPQVGRVTVSIGYTGIASGDTGPEAFGRADQALYLAKQKGRNQVQSYENLITKGALRAKTVVGGSVEFF